MRSFVQIPVAAAILAALTLGLASAPAVLAAEQPAEAREAACLPDLYERHVLEVHAGLSSGRTLADSLKSSASDEIEEALRECDNQFDLRLAVKAVERAEKLAKALGREKAVLPILSLLNERIRNIQFPAVDILKASKALARKAERLSKIDAEPVALDLPDGWSMAVISIADNNKDRRYSHFTTVAANHGLEVHETHDAGDVAGFPRPVKRYLISGPTWIVARIAEYYRGAAPTGFTAAMNLKSGGFFSTKETRLDASAPSELAPDAAFVWLNREVVAGGWKYVYENNYTAFKEHAKLEDGNNGKIWLVKGGEIFFDLRALASGGAVTVKTVKESYSDLYFPVK